jgi:exonuclease SbcD
MITFIHAADIHFGMENYGRIDSTTGIHTRLLDFHKALNICIDAAIKHDVDFFMFPGDAYKTAHPSPTQQRLLFECFLRLFKANIPIVMVIGNHDNPVSFGKAHSLDLFTQIPLAGFHVMSKPETLVLTTKSGPVQIVGIPWPSRTTLSLNKSDVAHKAENVNEYISKAVSSIIQHHADKLDPELPAVLAAHLTVSSGMFSGSEKRAIHGSDPLFLPSQLAVKPFDYVALGHLHRYQDLNKGGHPAVVYSGSIERIDFGERKEDKGYCLVTIKNKQETSHEFIKIPIRPFIQLSIKLHDESSQTDQIITEAKKLVLKNAIVKIIYHLPVGAKDRVDMRAIHNVCEDAHHLIGIFPVYAPKVREQRTQLTIEMSTESLLSGYFMSKQIPQERIKKLVQKTLELEIAQE